jgi:hypothetical protein
MKRAKQQQQAARLDNLAEDVQRIIAAHLAAPPPPGAGTTAWHDAATVAAAAAACMVACRGTQAIGLEAYRRLLAREGLPELPPPPPGLSADSSAEELQAALQALGAASAHMEATGRPVRGCRRAKLWQQLQSVPGLLCPVPASHRFAGSVRARAPWWDYLPPACKVPGKDSLRELHRLSLQHYGSPQACLDACQQRHRAAQNVVQGRDARRAVLVAALAAHGCTLRADSRLCAAYIDQGVGDPQHIAVVMEEMRFYFAHTNYKNAYTDILDSGGYTTDDEGWEDDEDGYDSYGYDSYDGYSSDGYDSHNGGGWGGGWRGGGGWRHRRKPYDPDHISELAKQAALERWARRYPGGPLAAAAARELPASLRQRVRAMAPQQQGAQH